MASVCGMASGFPLLAGRGDFLVFVLVSLIHGILWIDLAVLASTIFHIHIIAGRVVSSLVVFHLAF